MREESMAGFCPMTMRFTSAAVQLEGKHLAKCLGCERKFAEGDTTHLGYDSNGRALLVGDCCATRLSETAVRHYFLPRPFEVPPSHTPLWRYMNFAKYMEILRSRSLFFCRLDRLEDPFEGAMGALATEDKWCQHYLSFFRDAVRNPPPGYTCALSPEQVDQEAERLLREFRQANQTKPKCTFVNCWQEGNHESDAMWRLYSTEPEYAVAIGTTAGRLAKSIESHVTVGRVRYIDYSRQYPHVSYPHLFKRKAFEHEHEVRGIIINELCKRDSVAGLSVGVDLQQLILSVRVSPLAPDWFSDVVRDVTDRYELDVGACLSSLADAQLR